MYNIRFIIKDVYNETFFLPFIPVAGDVVELPNGKKFDVRSRELKAFETPHLPTATPTVARVTGFFKKG